MKKIYEILDKQDESGAWYRVYEVPVGMPTPEGFIEIPPPLDLKFPRFDYYLGWIEDKDAVIADLRDRLELAESAMIEIIDKVYAEGAKK